MYITIWDIYFRLDTFHVHNSCFQWKIENNNDSRCNFGLRASSEFIHNNTIKYNLVPIRNAVKIDEH
jgi:hypothetical protein